MPCHRMWCSDCPYMTDPWWDLTSPILPNLHLDQGAVKNIVASHELFCTLGQNTRSTPTVQEFYNTLPPWCEPKQEDVLVFHCILMLGVFLAKVSGAHPLVAGHHGSVSLKTAHV